MAVLADFLKTHKKSQLNHAEDLAGKQSHNSFTCCKVIEEGYRLGVLLWGVGVFFVALLLRRVAEWSETRKTKKTRGRLV